MWISNAVTPLSCEVSSVTLFHNIVMRGAVVICYFWSHILLTGKECRYCNFPLRFFLIQSVFLLLSFLNVDFTLKNLLTKFKKISFLVANFLSHKYFCPFLFSTKWRRAVRFEIKNISIWSLQPMEQAQAT